MAWPKVYDSVAMTQAPELGVAVVRAFSWPETRSLKTFGMEITEQGWKWLEMWNPPKWHLGIQVGGAQVDPVLKELRRSVLSAHRLESHANLEAVTQNQKLKLSYWRDPAKSHSLLVCPIRKIRASTNQLKFKAKTRSQKETDIGFLTLPLEWNFVAACPCLSAVSPGCMKKRQGRYIWGRPSSMCLSPQEKIYVQ